MKIKPPRHKAIFEELDRFRINAPNTNHVLLPRGHADQSPPNEDETNVDWYRATFEPGP